MKKRVADISIIFQVNGEVIHSNGIKKLEVISLDNYQYELTFNKKYPNLNYNFDQPILTVMRCHVGFKEKREDSIIIQLYPCPGTHLIPMDKIPISIFLTN